MEFLRSLSMQPDVFGYLPDNAIGRLMGIALILLLGWQGKGFIQAFREDRRAGRAGEVDLLEEVRKITKDEMTELRQELVQERNRRRKLERRVRQLERYVHDNHLDLPPDDV
jgi:hypothetical protein